MLDTYLLRTNQLLQSPAAPTELYEADDLTRWINQARGQVAGEGKCIRKLGTIPTVVGQREYNLSSINTGVPGTTGIQGVIAVRSVQYRVGEGQKWINTRGWTWFNFYNMNNPVPDSGEPKEWAQLGEGTSGNFYIDPIPDIVYTLVCDCICYPIELVDNSTPEAIPYFWTDAVPYFAAYLALMSSQAPARQNDAAALFEHYETFVDRARKFATPDVNYTQYPQNRDPAQMTKLGLQPKQGGQ